MNLAFSTAHQRANKEFSFVLWEGKYKWVIMDYPFLFATMDSTAFVDEYISAHAYIVSTAAIKDIKEYEKLEIITLDNFNKKMILARRNISFMMGNISSPELELMLPEFKHKET